MRIGFNNHLKSIGLGIITSPFVGIGVLALTSPIGVLAVPLGLLAGVGAIGGTYILGTKYMSNKLKKRRDEIIQITDLAETHYEHLEEIILKLDYTMYSAFREIVLHNFDESLDKRKTISYLQMWGDYAYKQVSEERRARRIEQQERDEQIKQRELEELRLRQMSRDQARIQYQVDYEDFDDRVISREPHYENRSQSTDINDKIGLKGNLNPKRVEEITGVKQNLNSKKVKRILK